MGYIKQLAALSHYSVKQQEDGCSYFVPVPEMIVEI